MSAYIPIPQRNPKNWYPHFASLALELLEGFITNVENLIEIGIKDYRNKGEDIEEVESYGHTEFYYSYGGVDGTTWHLKTIFEIHFPNLQRSHALILLFSTFEYELVNLCDLFSDLHGYSPKFNSYRKNLGGDSTILVVKKYLEEKIGLPINYENTDWEVIDYLKNLRNVIVHNTGLLKSDKVNTEILLKLNIRHDSNTNELHFDVGSLQNSLSYFNSFFLEIDKAISTLNLTD